ncbi:MAG: winged helix-turn-helix domain-containing protein [Holosporales bacterium]
MPPLHQEICRVLGKNISLSTVYRIAKRHVWRKIAPRPQHPKRNPVAAGLFKAFFPKKFHAIFFKYASTCRTNTSNWPLKK